MGDLKLSVQIEVYFYLHLKNRENRKGNFDFPVIWLQSKFVMLAFVQCTYHHYCVRHFIDRYIPTLTNIYIYIQMQTLWHIVIVKNTFFLIHHLILLVYCQLSILITIIYLYDNNPTLYSVSFESIIESSELTKIIIFILRT